jgi:mannose-6-phosphate isomerase-like protein (cupin superfamily)
MTSTPSPAAFVPRGRDRFDGRHNLGIGTLSFKVTTADSQGALVIIEIAHHTPGGPPRHVHPTQDEWFSVIEGAYIVEAGGQRFELGPGDSVFGPRGVPHTWAYTGGDPGRMLFVVSPAEQIEAFLRALSQSGAMAPQDPTFWHLYGLELVGPPLLTP